MDLVTRLQKSGFTQSDLQKALSFIRGLESEVQTVETLLRVGMVIADNDFGELCTLIKYWISQSEE